MKAYTLRMEDQELDALKQLGFKEHKSIKDIIMEAIREKFYKKAKDVQTLKERKILERAATLAQRLTTQQVIDSIREDRER